MSASIEDFITSRLRLTPLPFRPDIRLYRPDPQSGLHAWLTEQGRNDAPPYWAYAWAGGAALALYLGEHPEIVRDRTVLDFGAGSGLVGIAAAKAGAASVFVHETDPLAEAALLLNAAANGVTLTPGGDGASSADAEVILAGDVFYSPAVASRTLPVLARLAQAGRTVLVGDPFRRDLPTDALALLAEYQVPDMGGSDPVRAGVFRLTTDD